jgi:ATP-dependent Lon protease
VRARRGKDIGKTYGLAVAHHVGSIIEIEAVAFPAHEKRKGGVRFNDTAGSMAKDSVFNATSVVRAVAGIDPLDFDLHVNVVGGANIDGPSAGLGIFLALYSALTRTPLPRDVAVTGELSIAGGVRPVGGIVEKLYAARQAGMRLVLVPKENARDVDRTIGGIEIVLVATVRDALAALGIGEATARPLRRARRVAR